MIQMNWVFATNSDYPIFLSLQPDVKTLRYFKLIIQLDLILINASHKLVYKLKGLVAKNKFFFKWLMRAVLKKIMFNFINWLILFQLIKTKYKNKQLMVRKFKWRLSKTINWWKILLFYVCKSANYILYLTNAGVSTVVARDRNRRPCLERIFLGCNTSYNGYHTGSKHYIKGLVVGIYFNTEYTITAL